MLFARGQAFTLALKCEETSLSITVITRSTSWRSWATSICCVYQFRSATQQTQYRGQKQNTWWVRKAEEIPWNQARWAGQRQECLYRASQIKEGEWSGIALMRWAGKQLGGEQNGTTVTFLKTPDEQVEVKQWGIWVFNVGMSLSFRTLTNYGWQASELKGENDLVLI